MTTANNSTDTRTPRSRRPYEPPDIVSQEVFETTALACKKITGGKCGVSPKS
jgi:hypothetical protein